MAGPSKVICGIYGIVNKTTGMTYVGQSHDIEIRIKDHLSRLRSNKHYNHHLLRSFDKNGEKCFGFCIFEICSVEQLGIREQHWIDQHPRSMLYNQLFDVQHMQGTCNPFFGKKHTAESKNKMSKWKKENYCGVANPNYGKKNKIEVRLKMSAGRSSTLNADKVLLIAEMIKKSRPHQEIADFFGVSRTMVTRISNGTRWQNVTGGAIVPVKYHNGARQLSQAHKDRIGQKRKGRKHSDATRELMREKARSRNLREKENINVDRI